MYLRERKLLQTAPLSALAGSRLGIDAKHYLTHLLNSPDSQEPFVAATGGVHLSITQRVENDLRTLDRNHIKPVFIFAGLPTQGRPPPKGFDPQADRENRTKDEAWNWYENGEVNRAVQVLSAGGRGSGWTDYRDVVRLVLRVFKHRAVEYIFAPYLEQAQVRPSSSKRGKFDWLIVCIACIPPQPSQRLHPRYLLFHRIPPLASRQSHHLH